jgi:hypothetical protein
MTPPQAAAIHGPHLPVDDFFRSLAEDLGPRSIGIVQPTTAKYEGMPRSAFESDGAPARAVADNQTNHSKAKGRRDD